MYLGGEAADRVFGVTVNKDLTARVDGQTSSTTFPTVNPYQASFAGGYSDVFLTMIKCGC